MKTTCLLIIMVSSTCILCIQAASVPFKDPMREFSHTLSSNSLESMSGFALGVVLSNAAFMCSTHPVCGVAVWIALVSASGAWQSSSDGKYRRFAFHYDSTARTILERFGQDTSMLSKCTEPFCKVYQSLRREIVEQKDTERTERLCDFILHNVSSKKKIREVHKILYDEWREEERKSKILRGFFIGTLIGPVVFPAFLLSNDSSAGDSACNCAVSDATLD